MRREEDFFTGLGFDPFGSSRAPRRPAARPTWESRQVTVEKRTEAPEPETPVATNAEIEQLKARVAELEHANAELGEERALRTDTLARLQADFDNFRKRTERERDEASVRAAQRLIGELLPVLDNLERALGAAEQHEEAALVDGVRLVQRALADTLAREGVEEIASEGAFDPHTQEALMTQPSELPEGQIVAVLQKGYRLGDRIVRPARVIVSAGAVATAETTPPEDEDTSVDLEA